MKTSFLGNTLGRNISMKMPLQSFQLTFSFQEKKDESLVNDSRTANYVYISVRRELW